MAQGEWRGEVTTTITITESHQAFCREVARLARKHGLTNFGGSFRPGYGDEWRADISFKWETGRHDEDAGKISIWSQTSVNTSIDDPAPTVDEMRSRMIGRSP
jgi:hypothetical protein